MKYASLALFALLSLGLGWDARAQTLQNEATPEIKQVRRVYNEVEQAISRGELRHARREFGHCRDGEEALREIYVARGGMVRKFRRSAAVQDGVVQTDFYYDPRGTLRYAISLLRLSDGKVVDHRAYFDGDGTALRERQTQADGTSTAFDFGQIVTRPDLRKSPASAFNAKEPCS